ncbi:MFS transporter [Vibrio hyugaensis]|uniref:MFS transporter n=1 Tax=Vibrio hyugaensis TaxID=1534743 RepID=UPI0005EFE67F|nr:MFS transporter [Vibrio hyugaensis]
MKLINFILSSAINLLAFRSFNIILVWAVITNSEDNSLSLGLVVAIMWIFNLISLPISGDILDKYKKRTVLIYSSFISICSSLLFFLNLHLLESSIMITSICASILAATNSITSSSINSVIPFIAKKRQLDKAISLASTFNSLQTIIGVLLGGSLIAIFGVTISSVIIIFLYALSSLLVMFVYIDEKENESCNDDAFFKRLSAGFKVLYQIECERVICYTAMITNFVLTPLLMVVIPFYVVNALHSDAKLLAVFEATFALGMLLGASVLSRVDFNIHRRIYPVVIGNILMGVGIIGFSLLTPIVFKAFCLGISGFGLTSKGVACNSIRAFAVPNSHRARLESAIFFLCIATIPVGSQFFGYIINVTNIDYIDNILFFMGVIIILTSVFPILSSQTLNILNKPNFELDQLYKTKYPSVFGG